MAQGTHVYYNGVELRDCKTESFVQELCYDEARNATSSKFRIKVSSTVFGFYYSESGNLTDYSQLKSHPSTVETWKGSNPELGCTAADRMIIIQRRLSAPRKDFWYAITNGHREDRQSENIYQVLVAATGIPASEGDYFRDLFGNDIEIRYADYFHPNPLDQTSLALVPQKIERERCIDVNNGPITRNIEITELFGGKAFRVSVEFEVHRVMCKQIEPESSSKPNIFDEKMGLQASSHALSNTWSVEETMDDSWRRSKTIEGELKVRSRTLGYWSQFFRHLVLPGVLPGYRRRSMRFASDPTNIVLKYRVEDQQAEASPPAPAIDWKMTHVDSDRNEYSLVERQLVLELIGPPKANRLHLLGAALNMLDARFPSASLMQDDPNAIKGINGRNSFIRNALIVTTHAHDPTVTLVCSITLTNQGGGAPTFGGAIVASATMPSIAGYNPHVWPVPRPYDAKDPVGILGCYFQNPCSPWHGIFKNDQNILDNAKPLMPDPTYESNYWESENNPDYAVFESPIAFNDAATVSVAGHHYFPYTHVDIDTTYESYQGQMVLPLSGMRNIVPQNTEGPQPNPVMVGVCVTPIHPALMYRVLRVNCTRHGRPPELPEPAKVLVDPNGVLEYLVDKSEMVLDAPKLAQDNANKIFSSQMKLVYVLARPLGTNERYRSANNPLLVSAPGHNWTPGAAIFSRNRIEYHEEPQYPLGSGAHNIYSPFSPSLAVEVGGGYDETSVQRAEFPNYEYPGHQA